MPKEKDTEPTTAGSAAKSSLGKYLATVRTGRDMTLRQVEEATNRIVSNAYLSQIENDHIRQPSPNILLALADLYGVDYANLMERAGYVIPTKSRSAGTRHGRAATFADQNLTDEEESKLLEYLGFLRHTKR
jgi:transcriptional regulator with XRE-family HTH domain